MANFVFNIAKGRLAYYGTLPATNDGLVIVPLETTGLETDETLKDYDTLSALLAGSSNEQSTMGRKAATNVTVTVDDTPGNNKVSVDMDDITWTAATGNAISALLICYDPDTTGGDDTTIIPLSKHDFVVTPDGTDIVAQVATGGFFSAA